MPRRTFACLFLRILSVLIIAAAVSTPLQAQLFTGNATGVVKDQTTQAPIAGATVTSSGKSATTNSSGTYTLSGLPTGTQTITATATLYKSGSAKVTVYPFLTRTAPTIYLAENWGTVTGTVTNATTGQPISGAAVTLANTSFAASTDAGGHYTFTKVAAGTQTLKVTASGYNAASQSITVTAGATTTANVPLTAVVTTPPGGGGATITWNGSSTYLLGLNYAWYNYGTDFGTGGYGKYTDWNTNNSNVAAMKQAGVRVVRWWLFADGRYSPEFNSDGTVSGLDSSVLPDIDQALQIAANNNIYLLFAVIDSSMWSNANSDGYVQMGGHSAIVTNATAQQSFLDKALKPVLQHIAASPNRARVLGYDIVNEPESNMAGFVGGVNLQASQVQTFVKNCASYIHTYGGGAYATVGSAAPYWVGTWKGLGLDFYQLHYYPYMDFNGPAGSGLPTYASLNLDKPCIVGEYATADVNYNIGDTTPLSAQWYLDTISKDGYAGALGWSYWVADSATNWKSFQPVFTNWAQAHSAAVGPK